MTEQTEYIITDDMLAAWRTGCVNWRSQEDSKCYCCDFKGIGIRKGCCDFDDNAMQKIFQSHPVSEHEALQKKRDEEVRKDVLDEFHTTEMIQAETDNQSHALISENEAYKIAFLRWRGSYNNHVFIPSSSLRTPQPPKEQP
jgi:hypothetical protein